MRKNFEYLFIALLALLIAGFSPSYFFSNAESLPWQFHFHGIPMTAWFVLVIIQAYLFKLRKMKWHKILGWSSVPLAITLVISVYVIVQWSAHRVTDRIDHPGFHRFLLIPVQDTFLFALFYTLALIQRKNFHNHVRYILGATLFLLPPGTVRLQFLLFPGVDMGYFGFGFIINTVVLMGLGIFDYTKTKKIHTATIVVLCVFLMAHFAQPTIAKTELWLNIAKILTSYL